MKTYGDNIFSQRQLRVGELIKQNLGQIFLRDEAKVPNMDTKNITVTEVRMSPDLKNAKAYVIPLGGKDIEKFCDARMHCLLIEAIAPPYSRPSSISKAFLRVALVPSRVRALPHVLSQQRGVHEGSKFREKNESGPGHASGVSFE